MPVDFSRGNGVAIFKSGVLHKLMALDDEILTVQEVSELLRVHKATVYKLIRQGRIPAFRIGTDWRFRMESLSRWMAESHKGIPQ
jgi:excisionase family DNA binding protein